MSAELGSVGEVVVAGDPSVVVELLDVLDGEEGPDEQPASTTATAAIATAAPALRLTPDVWAVDVTLRLLSYRSLRPQPKGR